MKKNYLSLWMSVLLTASILMSCGGGSGNKQATDGFLGKLPAIVAEYQDSKDRLEAEEKAKAEKLKGKSADAVMKAMADLMEKDKKIKKQLEEDLKAEETILKNKEISTVNNNPSIEVTGLKVISYNDKAVRFKGIAVVKQALSDNWAKCQFQNKDGVMLQEANAFVEVPYEFGAKGAKEGTYDITVSFTFPNPNAGNLDKVVFVIN